ncbi:MAG: hypothetical protein AAFX01_01385 [Cyanobacteria bacterium J06638_28]
MMRISVCTLGACLLLGTSSATVAATTVHPLPMGEIFHDTLLAQSDRQTLLQFETQHYMVRVYEWQGGLYLNVYNKETGFTDQKGVPAYIDDPRSRDDDWLTYVNVSEEGDLEYLARLHPSGETELEIRVSDGSPARPEVGFDASYSFPYSYLGKDIDVTLTELEEIGWVVDDTRRNRVELTREQLALNLRFDPRTRLVTNTQLSSLS